MKIRVKTLLIVALGSLLSLLFAPLAHSLFYGGDGINFEKAAANEYLNNVCGVLDTGKGHCALAISADGYWASASAHNLDSAKIKALNRCKGLSLQPLTCQIIDEDTTSIFIANLLGRKGSTGQTTTVGNRALVGTGSGFVINDEYVVTADHVLAQCNDVSIRHQHVEIQGEIAARDPSNDLGLIRLDEKFNSFGRLRDGHPVVRGEMIANYGYPLFGQLSDAAKVTQGNINALAGWENDSRVFQFDAPTQPGNSGGPLLDATGNVVGVVSHMLSKGYAIQTDHIAQNVNFAVKSYIVEGFLTANGVTYDKAESPETLSLPKIAEKAETFTVLVGCWQ